MVKNLPANAKRHGFDPWSRKIPLATERLSSCATTIEPVLLNPLSETTEAWCPGARAKQ